jgi:hypothetical protein
MNGLTPEQEQARDRLHALLAELAPLLGPSGPFEDEDVPEEGAGWLLSSWALMATWVRADDGEVYLTRLGSANLPRYQRVGLFHEGIYGFDDD